MNHPDPFNPRPARPGRSVRGAVVLFALLLLSACSMFEGPGGPEPVVESVTIEEGAPSVRVDVGQAYGLGVSVAPEGAEDALTWSSSDESVAVVEDGTVTGIDVGSAVITARSAADADVRDTIEVEVDFRTDSPVAVTAADAEVVPGSRFRLVWEAEGEATFDVVAVPAEGSRDGVTLARDATSGVTLPIPPSDRPWIGLVAREADGAEVDRVEVRLRNVVTNQEDYDPYDAQGFEPEPEVPGSLRSVLTQAASGSVIGFAQDVRHIRLHGVDLEAVEGGPVADSHLILRSDVTISGPEDEPVVLEGVSGAPEGHPSDPFTWRSRVVFVPAGVEAVLENLVVTGGTFIYQGGGIRNDGVLTIRGSTITGNRAWELGGGIQNKGSLLLEDSVVSDNEALTTPEEMAQGAYQIRGGYEIQVGETGSGGGIDVADGTLTMVRTHVTGNRTRYDGGGLLLQAAAFAELTDTEFTGNDAGRGDAIFHEYVGEPDNLVLTNAGVSTDDPRYESEAVTQESPSGSSLRTSGASGGSGSAPGADPDHRLR